MNRGSHTIQWCRHVKAWLSMQSQHQFRQLQTTCGHWLAGWLFPCQAIPKPCPDCWLNSPSAKHESETSRLCLFRHPNVLQGQILLCIVIECQITRLRLPQLLQSVVSSGLLSQHMDCQATCSCIGEGDVSGVIVRQVNTEPARELVGHGVALFDGGRGTPNVLKVHFKAFN